MKTNGLHIALLWCQGAATGAYSREEAYKNIREVLQMTPGSMIFHGETIPVDTSALTGELIAVTV